MKTADVVAVIPYQGSREEFVGLQANLWHILEWHDYDGVVVVDGSRHGGFPAQLVTADYDDSVTTLVGKPGAARADLCNQALTSPQVHDTDIAHFLHPQSRPISPAIPEIAREKLADPRVGALGGLIVNVVNGGVEVQNAFNYGPAFSLAAYAGGAVQELARQQEAAGRDRVAGWLRSRFAMLLEGYPDLSPGSDPVAGGDREVFWVHEANMLARVSQLWAAGGFPRGMDFHAAQVIGINMERQGKLRLFTPDIVVQLPPDDNQFATQLKYIWDALKIVRAHGVGAFLSGDYPTSPH